MTLGSERCLTGTGDLASGAQPRQGYPAKHLRRGTDGVEVDNGGARFDCVSLESWMRFFWMGYHRNSKGFDGFLGFWVFGFWFLLTGQNRVGGGSGRRSRCRKTGMSP